MIFCYFNCCSVGKSTKYNSLMGKLFYPDIKPGEQGKMFFFFSLEDQKNV